MEQEVLNYALKNWRNLNEVVGKLREDQLKYLIETEMKTERRWTVVERLHQRYTTVRAARERKEFQHDLAS